MAESFPVPDGMVNSNREREEIKANTIAILEFLDEAKVKGTFFILGNIAEEQPEVVKLIAENNHEIASHSYKHRRLYCLDKSTAHEYINRSKKALEDVSGKEVAGFRAPDFSVNSETLYLLDMVQEAGYKYDSSIPPISGHDVYGVEGAERGIYTLPNGLIEFPPATFPVFGKVVPVLGGGYFRLLPLFLSKMLLKMMEKRNEVAMSYIHPYEMGPSYPVIKGLSASRRFRHYVNIDKSMKRFGSIFKKHSFGKAIDILESKGVYKL